MTSSPGSSGSPSKDVHEGHALNLRLDGFTWETIEQESARLGVSAEDLIGFAVLYYLADVDSGRVARRITRSPFTRASRDLS
ncbi:MAG: hypothetical protein ABSG95_01670 [Solirubrobacteraceae bacterium]|jgi:hypothetical protein